MKLITPEQQQGHFEATIWGTIKGAAISGAIAGPAYALLNRRSATWRALPLPAKAFAIVVVAVPTITITAEKAGEAYDRSQWTGVGKRELDAEAQRETERWQGLTTTERMTDFAKQNKYGLIAAGWGASMIGSFAMVSRNKTLTFSRKIVQARVYAQALTIAMVFIAAIASGTGKSETEYVTTRSNDHSWKNILEQEGYSKESLDGPSTSESANRSMRERAQQLKGASQIADPPKGAEQ